MSELNKNDPKNQLFYIKIRANLRLVNYIGINRLALFYVLKAIHREQHNAIQESIILKMNI